MKKLFVTALGFMLTFHTVLSGSCPTGFIPVVGNSTLGVDDFCVQQFEAKNVNGVPVSQAEGTPWVRISAHSAFSACATMNETGFPGSFALISNPEWMTIARHIETEPSNWSGGSVGQGMIFRGHSDADPSMSLAVSDTNDPYIGTGNDSGQGEGTGWEQGRRHTLAQNNARIWDFAGNVYEWVDWIAEEERGFVQGWLDWFVGKEKGFTKGPRDSSYGRGKELNDLDGSIRVDDLGSSGDYISTHGMGRWYGGSGGAANRGGFWNGTANAGVFSLNLGSAPTDTYTSLGFRCVYRP